MAAWFLRHGVAFSAWHGAVRAHHRSLKGQSCQSGTTDTVRVDGKGELKRSLQGERVFSSSVSHSGLIVFCSQGFLLQVKTVQEVTVKESC